MKPIKTLIVVFGLILFFLAACDKNPVEPPYDPVINPADFVANIDNPYFPLTPGTTFNFRATTAEGNEAGKVVVTHDTKEILGVRCVVVADTVWLEGVLKEATFDWYAQHQDGTVWYFGEAVDNYENGVIADHDGSFEAGVDGAKPGIIMKANPQVGDSYRQEFYKGEAEDEAEVLGLNEAVTITFGAFQNCVKTKEWTQLEPDIEANKYYAAGVGVILEIHTKGPAERNELINITTE